MSVISIFPNNESYEILSTDITDNKVAGLQSPDVVGKKIYVTDKGITYTILSDYTLSPSYESTSVTEQASLGQFPIKRVTVATEITPDTGYIFCAIQAESDVVINTTTGNITNFDGASITSECTRYGRWSSITLTSGTALLYQIPV